MPQKVYLPHPDIDLSFPYGQFGAAAGRKQCLREVLFATSPQDTVMLLGVIVDNLRGDERSANRTNAVADIGLRCNHVCLNGVGWNLVAFGGAALKSFVAQQERHGAVEIVFGVMDIGRIGLDSRRHRARWTKAERVVVVRGGLEPGRAWLFVWIPRHYVCFVRFSGWMLGLGRGRVGLGWRLRHKNEKGW